MKEFILSVALISTLSLAAHAADLPDTKAAPTFTPPPPQATSWTGFYAGVNVGYGIGSDPTTISTYSGTAFPFLAPGTPIYGLPQRFNLSPRGVVGGGQIGYNYQLSPNWVAGIETDFQGSDMRARQNCIMPCGTLITASTAGPLAFAPETFSQNSEQQGIDWFGTLRGRVGYAMGPVLIYGTGGLAYGDVTRSGNVVGSSAFFGIPINTFAGSYSASSVKVGWTAGAGVEGKIAPNWSVKAEYLYVDLGDTSDTFSTFYTGGFPGPGQAAVRTVVSRFQENIFRVGVNYQFDAFAPPAPVVAKY